MDYLDLLNDPAYRHTLLNHVPIVGLAVAAFVLATGLALRQRAILLLGLVLVALTAGISFPVARFGDAAYPGIYDTLDGHGRAWLDHHSEVADTWLPLLLVTAGLAMLVIAAGLAKQSMLMPLAAIVLIAALVSLGVAGNIARSGGQIQHPEFRLNPTPE